MKKLSIITKSIVMTISMISIASAKVNSWTGLYVGANANVGFNNAELTSQQLGFTSPDNSCDSSSHFSTYAPGAQVGYLYQFANNWVSGVEASLSLNTPQKTTLGCTSAFNSGVYDRFSFRTQFQSTMKGRLGHTLDWNNNMFLPYFTAGVSVANVGLTYQNEGGNYYSQNISSPGWLVGAGLEWVLNQSWSLRAEYSYVSYGNAITLSIPSVYDLIDPNGSGHINLSSSNISVSINYWI